MRRLLYGYYDHIAFYLLTAFPIQLRAAAEFPYVSLVILDVGKLILLAIKQQEVNVIPRL